MNSVCVLGSEFEFEKTLWKKMINEMINTNTQWPWLCKCKGENKEVSLLDCWK